MQSQPPKGDHTFQRRSRRRASEIIIAIVLTVAALVFIAAALFRSTETTPAEAPFDTARKPLPH
jgi:hypothetical protein